ncbi:MAG: iron-containing alcohol dehydrogenase [bacterium]|nr:iron-containing alcohol dehydrogenase [bacterium]
MRFEFATAARIVFGNGSSKEIGTLAAGMGSRALIVTGRDPSRATALIDDLGGAFIDASTHVIDGEPTVGMALAGVKRARETACDLIIGFGGGSALDAAKAIAALATNPGDPVEYLEVIGNGKPLRSPPLPFIAIPTTAGTGSEVTRNAVLASPEHKVKVSLRSPLMLARLAVVDPELTHKLPPAVTASTGMDALAQVLEPFVSSGSNPITDGYCREGLPRAARSLLKAYKHGNDAAAREDMAMVSLLGGLALANAKLGAAHGFAGPLGGMFDAPHGAVVAALLPHVMAVNIRALTERQPESQALRRYTQAATLLTGKKKATAQDGAAFVADLVEALSIPRLAAYGIKRAHLAEIVQKSATSNSMKGNPLALTADEMTEILERAL